MARLAPSLRNLFDEINEVWPRRDRRSDGWIGDKAHQARQSDHNPDSRGIVHAIDIDRDGINVNTVISACIRDDRPTSYVVYSRRIWTRSRNWESREYRGSNPHTSHIHVSILHGTNWESERWNWGISSAAPGTAPAPVMATDDMTEWRSYFDTSGDAFVSGGNTLDMARRALITVFR